MEGRLEPWWPLPSKGEEVDIASFASETPKIEALLA